MKKRPPSRQDPSSEPDPAKPGSPAGYRYGSPRQPGEGLRIGSAHFIPRGIPRKDWQVRGYFDIWLPLLSPDPEAIKTFRAGRMTFAAFARRYRARLKKRECAQMVELLAVLSLFQPISIGCFCEDESRCHRSLLRDAIRAEAAKRRSGFKNLPDVQSAQNALRYASPVCFADWEEFS